MITSVRKIGGRMVKKYSIIVVFALVSLCSSCQRFRVLEVGGETILKNPKYKLEYTLDEKGMQPPLGVASRYVV
jgi:hypothetical protein